MRAAAGALVSAALLGLVARVEAPWHPLSLVALAPWFWGLDRSAPRAALTSAALLATAFTASAFWWLPGTVAAYTGCPRPLAWLGCLALAPLVLQPQLLAAAGARLLARRLVLSHASLWPAVATALTYVFAEWALPRLFADTLGYGLFPSPWLRQAADLGGGAGLTLSCLAVSECAARRTRLAALGAALVVLALAGYGAVRLRQVEARTVAAPVLTAGVVQANITAYDKLAAEQGTFETVRQILETHVALSRELLAQGPLDLLVWPETVYPTTFGAPKSGDGAAFDQQIAAMAREARAPLVFGAFEADALGEHNAAFFLDADGSLQASYQKSLLFPLTEYVPRWLDSSRLRAVLPWAGRWQPGPGPRVLPLRLRDGSALRVAPLICYEAIHQDYVERAAGQGAQVLLTLSNDAWFPAAAGARLHLTVAAFRSIETRLPQLRATNSGISALVLPSGEIVSATAFDSRAAIRLRVPRVAGAAGSLLPLGPACAAGCAVLALLALARKRRTC